MLCAKFGWNWPCGSGKKIFKFPKCMYFRYFIIIFLWEMAGTFILINLNPLHPGMLRARFSRNWPWLVLEKKILKFHKCTFAISKLSPLGKGQGPSFYQTYIPFSYVWLNCAKFGRNWSSGSGEQNENVTTTTMTTTTDNRQILIRKADCPSTIKCQHKKIIHCFKQNQYLLT